MNCKNCQQELEEGVTLCPACGTDNTEPIEETLPINEETHNDAQQEPVTQESEAHGEEKNTKADSPSKKEVGKIAIAFTILVALLMVLIALVLGGGKNEESADETGNSQTTETTTPTSEATEATVPVDTGLNDSTCKGTYTVSDETVLAELNTVVATLESEEMTVADLQVYYWMQVRSFLSEYYYYILYGQVNIDYTQSLDTQVCGFDETKTWQQYFIDSAISCWQEFTGMALAAQENGIQMQDDLQADLDGMEDTLAEMAETNGFDDIAALLEYNMGPGATYEAYARYMRTYYMGYSYYMQLYEASQPTEDEVRAYYEEHTEDYEAKEGKVVDVRHILIMPQGGTYDEESQTTTYSDEEWNDCYTRAEAILNEWLTGEMTEDSFGELANAHSEDPGSNTVGGLYTDVTEGYMTEAFNDWCFDESRTPGDYGLVKTPFGWHVMYFVSSADSWYSYAREDLLYERVSALMDEAVADYGMDVNYNAMVLGYLDLAA